MVLIIVLVAAGMLGTIANLTTGITIAHTGFTPNPNVTGSPGYTSLIRVVPLVFVGAALGYLADEMGKVL